MPEVVERKCEQCGKTMNPVEYIVCSVCGECVKKNHVAAVGMKSRRDTRRTTRR